MSERNPETKAGTYALGCLATLTCAWEIWGSETISSAWDRYLEHPVKKIAAIGAVALTGAHLLNLPEHFGLERYDPFENIGKLYGRLRDGR